VYCEIFSTFLKILSFVYQLNFIVSMSALLIGAQTWQKLDKVNAMLTTLDRAQIWAAVAEGPSIRISHPDRRSRSSGPKISSLDNS